MKSIHWFLVSVLCAFLGVGLGYGVALVFKPALIPPELRFGSLHEPTTVMLLGTDVVYTDLGNRSKKIDKSAFTGRSDTIMVARLDPIRNAFGVLSIPRDTEVKVQGVVQKVNAANAIGGPTLAVESVSNFLKIPIDHYVVLNVSGLVELVNELGGITVEIPKKMQYMDWTAKLKIDLEPGMHTLTGNQAMGFVRFRHDALGDIGRVQRQQIFIRAVLQKAMSPESWTHIPKLIEIAGNYISTDMTPAQMMSMAAFVRAVPKEDQFLTMLPGSFAGNGDWVSTKSQVRRIVAKLIGSSFATADRKDMIVSVENDTEQVGLGDSLAKLLRSKGYTVSVRSAEGRSAALAKTRIIAQKANPDEAALVKADLGGRGDIVNASVGDIESAVTVQVGDDLKDQSPAVQ